MKFLAAFLFLIGTAASAATVTGTVTWEASSTSGLVKIDGTGGNVTGDFAFKDGKALGIFECVLADFTTGMPMRDGHMRDKYLEVQKFPKAVLKLDPVQPGTDTHWTGQLTLKGVTKPVTGTATITPTEAFASFTVMLDDYPVGVPGFMGVTVAKAVNIKVHVQAGK